MQDCRERAVTRLSGGKIDTAAARAQVLRRPMPDQSGPWVPRMIETLREFKLLGLEFHFAWRVALRQHPPRTLELGRRDDPEALAWFHGVCQDAWFDMPAPAGTPSKLRGLRQALEGGFLPHEDAGARGRVRALPVI